MIRRNQSEFSTSFYGAHHLTSTQIFYQHKLIENMFRLFRKPKVHNLQRQYDKLMHEAYVLSKSNPTESMEKQKLALEIQRQIVDRGRMT